MIAFITGSRVYGKAKQDSDIDLVVRTDHHTVEQLLKLSGGELPIRFGNLNLILCTTDEEFAVWKLGTVYMIEEKDAGHSPFSKIAAKAVFDNLREMIKIKDKPVSGD